MLHRRHAGRPALLPGVLALALALPLAAQQDAGAPPAAPAADAFAALAVHYAYDVDAPLNAEVVSSRDVGGTTVEEIAFDSANGERITALLVLPPAVGKRPLVVTLHGYGQSKEMLLQVAPMLPLFGIEYAFLALDAQYHGSRRQPGIELLSSDIPRTQRGFVQTVVDYRRALDYVTARDDIANDRVGVAGLSMGAMMGTILTALEPRVKTAVLAVGGGDWRTLAAESTHPAAAALRSAEIDWDTVQPLLDSVDPVGFAPYFSDRPVLLLNALRDEVIPNTCAQKLHDAAIGPKVVKEWYDSGHTMDQEVLGRLMLWFQENL